MKFDNLKDLMIKYPIDNKRNFYYKVEEYHIFCPTPLDVIEAKNLHPLGRFNKIESNYYYCNIRAEVWYTHYVYDGTYWYLGDDNWDGIYQVNEEPDYKIVNNEKGLFFGVFKTEEEAYECVKKRYSMEEVCRF